MRIKLITTIVLPSLSPDAPGLTSTSTPVTATTTEIRKVIMIKHDNQDILLVICADGSRLG
jgi:hypothetical protein